MSTRPSKADIEMARERIMEHVPAVAKKRRANGSWEYEGQRPVIYQLVRSVARSGMSRVISTYAVSDGQLVCLDWAIGTLVGGLKREGVRISGCGMDMGFALMDHALHEAYKAKLEAVPYTERPNGNDIDRRWL